MEQLNFPLMLPPGLKPNMSPTLIQKAASDAGMATDAHLASEKMSQNDVRIVHYLEKEPWEVGDEIPASWEESGSELKDGEGVSISVEDYL